MQKRRAYKIGKYKFLTDTNLNQENNKKEYFMSEDIINDHWNGWSYINLCIKIILGQIVRVLVW